MTSTDRFTTETVLTVHYWTPSLLSFHLNRPANFQFIPGQYARLGLDNSEQQIIWRPFSLVSGPLDNHLEFFAVLVPGGKFSEPLSNIQEGSTMHIEKVSYGFMTTEGFAPGRDLWLLSTGTGLGPFVSILRDPTSWQMYDNIIVVHSVRSGGELAYHDEILSLPGKQPEASGRLHYIPIVTRETWPGALTARIPQLIDNGQLEQITGVQINPQYSRIMACGNPQMTSELRSQLIARGFHLNRRSTPGQLALENYWQHKAS